jgi:hypothetical protein
VLISINVSHIFSNTTNTKNNAHSSFLRSRRALSSAFLANRSTGDLEGVMSVMEDTIGRFLSTTCSAEEKTSNSSSSSRTRGGGGGGGGGGEGQVLLNINGVPFFIAEKVKAASKLGVIHGGSDWLEAKINSKSTRRRAVHGNSLRPTTSLSLYLSLSPL